MQILVSGQHISIGISLQEYVKQRIDAVVHKYFEDVPSSHINFSKQGHEFYCDIIVNDGTGRNITIKSKQHSDDVYSSFDITLSKIEIQLRKYKSKLKDRSHKVKLSELTPEAIKYTISPTRAGDDANIIEVDVDNPVIIAEKLLSISTLSVGEAVMKMDLENLPALLFKNSKTDKVSVVYYRKDGNISWVESK